MALDLKAIEGAFKKIEKSEGREIIQNEEDYTACDYVPCGSPELNKALGGKGLIVSRVIEIFGSFSGGKSLLATYMASEYQKSGFYVIMFDFERSFDYRHSANQGLDVSDEAFKLITPEEIYQGFEIAETLAKSSDNILFIFDSVSSMLTQTEIDSSYDKASIGLQARAMSSSLKRLVPVLSDNNCTAIFINQVREKIGSYVPTEVTSGGRSLGFYSSLRLRVRKTEDIMEGDDAIGFKQAITVVKNKLAPPKGKAELTFYYSTGIDTMGGILDEACEQGLINKKAGGNFYLTLLDGEELRVRGKLNLMEYAREHPDYFEDLKVKLGLEASVEEE